MKDELIARFLRYDILSNGHYNFEGELSRSLPDFENDWSSLMKVVEKLGKTNGVVITMGTNLRNKQYCYIEMGTAITQQGDMKTSGFFAKTIESDSLQEATYEVVVLFLEWFNKLKK